MDLGNAKCMRIISPKLPRFAAIYAVFEGWAELIHSRIESYERYFFYPCGKIDESWGKFELVEVSKLLFIFLLNHLSHVRINSTIFFDSTKDSNISVSQERFWEPVCSAIDRFDEYRVDNGEGKRTILLSLILNPIYERNNVKLDNGRNKENSHAFLLVAIGKSSNTETKGARKQIEERSARLETTKWGNKTWERRNENEEIEIKEEGETKR